MPGLLSRFFLSLEALGGCVCAADGLRPFAEAISMISLGWLSLYAAATSLQQNSLVMNDHSCLVGIELMGTTCPKSNLFLVFNRGKLCTRRQR